MAFTPAAAYNFDEVSGVAIDYSGHGRNVTVDPANRVPAPNGHGGGDSGGIGSVNTIAYLAGGTSGIPISTYETPARSATWWADVYNTGGVSIQMVGWFQNDTPHASQPALSIGIQNTIAVLRATGSDGVTGTSLGWSYTSAWHHFGCSYDPLTGIARAYMDGAQAASVTLSAPRNLIAAQQVMADPYGVDIGGGGVVVDDIRLYDTVIDLAQVQADMAAPPSGLPETRNIRFGGAVPLGQAFGPDSVPVRFGDDLIWS